MKTADIERIRAVMKLGAQKDEDIYKKGLADVVAEFGIEAVSQYACQMCEGGGAPCAIGHCQRPDGYGATAFVGEDEEITCQQACADYYELFVSPDRPTAIVVTDADGLNEMITCGIERMIQAKKVN